MNEINDAKRGLTVIHGGFIAHSDLMMERRKRARPLLGDPLQLLFDHVRNSNLRLWDLFAQFDKDKSLSLTRDEFKHGMRVSADVTLEPDDVDQYKNNHVYFCRNRDFRSMTSKSNES